jgi:hypothetical protein
MGSAGISWYVAGGPILGSGTDLGELSDIAATPARNAFICACVGLKPVTTPVSSPQSNGMVESLVKTIKRDYAALALRLDTKTIMRQLGDWFEHYQGFARKASVFMPGMDSAEAIGFHYS